VSTTGRNRECRQGQSRSAAGADAYVTGPLIWLDENGEPNGTFDVFDYIALVREHYEKNGIGADYIDKLFR
jgi:hypothetical protein